jgi:CubicO group peptidase (beta-lactamase class C family)
MVAGPAVLVRASAPAAPSGDRSDEAIALTRVFGPIEQAPESPVSLKEALAEYDAWASTTAAQRAGAVMPSDAQEEPWDTIDACMSAEMSDRGIPGASLAAMKEGELAYAKGYGLKHEDRPEDPVDTETIFRIGSTTKMMTAAALMQQVEAGRIDTGAPITDIITDFVVAGTWDYAGVGADDITAHHMLSHSSGYPDNVINYFQGFSGPTTNDALAAWVADQGEVVLHAPPGSFWNYSNSNFSLAGRMVELAADKPYPQLMAERLWRPLEMDDTHLMPADVLADGNYSFGHGGVEPLTGAPLPPHAPDDYDSAAIAPAGYAFSTPTDMVRWAEMLMAGGEEVLSQASVDTMHASHVPVGVVPEQTYGYGIFVEDLNGLNVYNHGGNISGWSSQMLWAPERGIAVSILSNTIDSMSRSLGCAARALLELEPQPDPDRSTEPATWQRYTGSYTGLNVIGDEMTLNVSHGGDHLLATFPDIIAPGVDFTSTMQQAAFDSFAMDTDGDRVPDSVVTFIDEPDAEGDTPRWLRHRSFVLTHQGDVPEQATPTAGTPAPTGTPVPPTPTVAPPASPTPEPSATTAPEIPTQVPPVNIQPEVCGSAEARVSAAIRAAALANPAGVLGYGQRCFPSQPASPFNPLRDKLDLQHPNRPFHPIFNPLVFTCGCR